MISDRDIYSPPNDYIHGREDEVHITVLYGIDSPLCEQSEMVLCGQRPFEVELGQVSIFTTNEDFDVVKIEAIGPGLFYLNNLLKNTVHNTPCYAGYKPHVTIAYVKKDSCRGLIGRRYFEGWRWTASSLVFSSKYAQKTAIRLNTLRPVLYS